MAVQELLIRLGLENASFSKKMKGVQKEISLLEAEYKGISESVKNFEGTQEGLATKMEHISKVSSVVAKGIKVAENEFKELKSTLAKCKEDMAEFSKKMEKTSEEIAKTEKKLQTATEVTQKFQKNVDSLKSIQAAFEKSSQTIKKYKESISYCEKEYKKLSDSIGKNKNKINELKAANEKLTNTITKENKNLSQLETKYKKNTQEIDKLQKKYAAVSKEYGKNSAEAKKLKTEMNNLEKENKQVETSITKVKTALDKSKKSHEQNVASIKKLTQENQKYLAKQKELVQQISKNEQAIKKEEQSYKKLANEMSNHGIKAKSLKDAMEKVNQALKKEERALHNSTQAQQKHKDKLEALKKEQISLSQQLDKTEKKYRRTKEAMHNAQLTIAEYTAKQKALNRELKETAIDKHLVKLKETGKQYTLLGSTLQNFGSKFQSIGRSLTYGLSMPIAGFGAAATRTFTEFEERIRKVNATFGGSSKGMQAQFNQLSESARKFGRETEWTAKQVGEGYEYMAMAGWTVEKSTSAMEPMLNLASIGMLDLGRATDIVTDTMTPFSGHLEKVGKGVRATGKEFNEAKYMADIFASTISNSNTNVELMGETFKYSAGVMASYGVTMKDLAFVTGIFADAGQKGSRAGTQLSTGLNRLVKPTKQAQKVMNKYGVEVKKTKDGSVDLMATMNNMRAKLGKLDATEKGRIMTTIFGQQAQRGWISVLNATTEQWDKMTKAMKESDGATDRMMEEISKSGAYQFKIMKSAIQDFLIVVGDALAPAMKDIAKWFMEIANKLSNWVTKMRETNPEMLSLIGKFSLIAVVVPPLITLFGFMTKGLGGLFSATGSAISGFVNFKKQTMKVARGVATTDGKVGLLAKGVGGLVAKFGGVAVAVGGAGVALTGLATVVGQNDDALSWLQDTLGGFGEFVAITCEMISGWVKMTFGNILILLQGVGKAIIKFIKGDWFEIDDVMSETWSRVKNNTAEAWSDINQETSWALKRIKSMTQEELNDLANKYKETSDLLPEIFKGGIDGLDDNLKGLTATFHGVNNTMIENLRGTSESMAVLLEGIKEDMSFNDVEWQLKKNLEDMMQSGKYTASSMEADFKKAGDLINRNFGLSLGQVQKKATKFTQYISQITARGHDEVANNITEHMKTLDNQTFEHIKSMGKTWGALFEGVSKDSSSASKQIAENLRKMGGDSEKIMKALTDEIKGGLEEISTTGKEVANETGEAVGEVADSMAKFVNTVGKTNSKNLKNSSEVIIKALEEMDSKTRLQLMKTNDNWYSLISGTMDKSGNLVDGFKETVIGNLNWISKQSPEKMKGFNQGILDALVKNNVITKEQMEAFKKSVDANVGAAGKKSKESVKEVCDSMKLLVKELQDGATVNLGALTNRTVESLETLDKETVTRLMSTSKEWKKILSGAVTDGGELSNNYQKIILENFTKATKGSHQEVLTFKKNILQGLVDANIITKEQMEEFKNVVIDESKKAKEGTKDTGKDIGNNVAPKEAETKTRQELNDVNNAIKEQTGQLKESSKDAGTKSSEAFANEINKIKEKVKINDSIINIQELENQMKGAGALGITAFAQGWVENTNILVNGINTSIAQANAKVTEAMTGLHVILDDVAIKMSIVTDKSTEVKNKMDELNSTGLGNLKTSIESMVDTLGKTGQTADESKGKIVGLANTPELGSMNKNIKGISENLKEIGSKATASANDVRILSNVSLSKLDSALKDCIKKLKDIKENADKVKTAFDKIINQSFKKIDGQLKSINDKLQVAKERADKSKTAIQNINNITMSNAINQLSKVADWLKTVRSDANNTASALESVNKKRSFVGRLLDGLKRSTDTPAAFSLADSGIGMDAFANMRTPTVKTDHIDIANYKTSGGYYSPQSIVGKTPTSRAQSVQNEQIELLKKNQEILMQILLTERQINVDFNVDSKQFAKATAREMNKEIQHRNKISSRLGGRF